MTPAVLDSVASPSSRPLGPADAGPPGSARRPEQQASSEPSADDVALVRRQLRIRLLRDLVSNGLYQVPTEALADRLIGVLSGGR